MSFVIIDIDNTIADDGWRIRYIKWLQTTDMDARYDEYHKRAGFDFAKNRHLVRAAHPTAEPLFLTSRPVKFRAYTERWLTQNYLPRGRPFQIIMRNDHDHRHSVEVKHDQLHWLELHYGVRLDQIECAYDDRQDIIDMYREHGVNAQLIHIHNKDAYATPKSLQAKIAAAKTATSASNSDGAGGSDVAGRHAPPVGVSIPLEHWQAVDPAAR